MSVYLDYNATAPVRPEAAEAMTRALAVAGNPSSVHAAGRAARSTVEAARAEVAELVGVKVGSVTFLSGGTEANALAIESARAAGFARLIVSAADHDAVIENARAGSVPVELWPVDGNGLADLAWLRAALAEPGRALVCIALANNETGVMQDAAAIAEIVRAADGWLHLDAVQAAGKVPVDFTALGADTLALSAHKLGSRAVIVMPVTVARRLHGGGQERGRRAGTENVPGIAGFGAAAKVALRELDKAAGQAEGRDALAARIRAAGGVVIGEGAPRLPQTLCFAAPGFGSELQVMSMDLAGVMVSAGAACSSGKVKASRVVEAMGRDDLAPYVLRVSGGWATSPADWAQCGDVWLTAYERWSARKAVA